MGCGASASPQEYERVRPDTLAKYSTAPTVRDEALSLDTEAREVHAELKGNSQYSGEGTNSAYKEAVDEPGDFSKAMSWRVKVVKASLMHDINDDPDQFPVDNREILRSPHVHKAYRHVSHWMNQLADPGTSSLLGPSTAAPSSAASTALTVPMELSGNALRRPSSELDIDKPAKEQNSGPAPTAVAPPSPGHDDRVSDVVSI
jgi:hypothetical protein